MVTSSKRPVGPLRRTRRNSDLDNYGWGITGPFQPERRKLPL